MSFARRDLILLSSGGLPFEAGVTKRQSTNHMKFPESFCVSLHIIKQQGLVLFLHRRYSGFFKNRFRLPLKIYGVPNVSVQTELENLYFIFTDILKLTFGDKNALPITRNKLL